MPTLGAPELIIILVIIVLIFGVGKLPEVGAALGKGIREFRGAAENGLGGDDKKEEPKAEESAPAAAPKPAAIAAPVATAVAAGLSYVVQQGDTLESIAKSHAVPVEAVMTANGFAQRDRVLYPGDKVQIPSAG
jgi:sec-independent protein translocase protein TatA